MYPLTLLTEELKSDEVETRIKAMRRLRTVAQALGPERTRSDLLPFLRGKPVCGTHHSLFFTRYSVTNDRKHVGLTAAEATEDEDEVVVALAEELGGFVDLVGGAEHASILVEPFEVLAGVEETVVRDRAVDSLQKVVAVVPNVDDVMVPLAKRLAEGDWFTSRVSVCALFASIYSKLADAGRKKELREYVVGVFVCVLAVDNFAG